MIKKQFTIKDMQCVGCTIAVEGAIEDLPGVQSAKAQYAKQTAVVDTCSNKQQKAVGRCSDETAARCAFPVFASLCLWCYLSMKCGFLAFWME